MPFALFGNNLRVNNIKMSYKDLLSRKHWALEERASFNQFAKFILIGIFNTALNYGTFFVLLAYTSYLVSLVIAHVIGVLNSFVWNKYWTFGSRELRFDEFIKFNLLYVIYFISNGAMLVAMVDYLHFTPQMGQLIALPTLTIISFAGQKYWSFKKT